LQGVSQICVDSWYRSQELRHAENRAAGADAIPLGKYPSRRHCVEMIVSLNGFFWLSVE
jgi:hypothetical protein